MQVTGKVSTNVSHLVKLFDMGINVKYHKKLLMRVGDLSSDQVNSIYLRVTINRVQLRMTTPIRVKSCEFNCKTGEIKIAGNPKLSHDYTRVLAASMAKAENIFTKYMLMESPLTIDKFKAEWSVYSNRNSFITFMKAEIDDIEKNRSRTKSTITIFNTILGKLEDFAPTLSFNDLDEVWAESFDRYLYSKNLAVNTRQKAHKTVKKFVNIAMDKRFLHIDPYAKFKVKRIKANRQHLHIDEIKKLIEYEKTGTMPESYKNVLRAFLFSVYTGARLSDVREFDQKSIINDILIFKPLKTVNDSIIVRVPLSAEALALCSKTNKLFTCLSDNKLNAALKTIANFLEIKTNLTFHIARHSFGTHYILSGGNLVELMHLMGHSKTETTMVYVHMADEIKASKKGISKFGDYLQN